MFKVNYKKQILNKGFTLLEVLVAISILMVAVVAPITIAQKGLSSSGYSRNQMIASYLAQDAIEYIKNRRDYAAINSLDATYNLHNYDWSGFLTELTLCKDLVGCEIDTINNNISVFSDTNPLKKDSNNFYQYLNQGCSDPAGCVTNFTRKINMQVNDLGGGKKDEALVTVTVRWGTSDEQVIVNTLIYNY